LAPLARGGTAFKIPSAFLVFSKGCTEENFRRDLSAAVIDRSEPRRGPKRRRGFPSVEEAITAVAAALSVRVRI
jgi:hypothetical protein